MTAFDAQGEPRIVVLVRLLNAVDEGHHSFEALKGRIAEGGRRPSTRSLRRYLSVLTDAGFPIHFDRGSNTYRFAGGYSLKRLDLDQGELFGLVALRSLGASIGGAIGASIDEVTDKLVGTAGRTASAHVQSASPVAFRLAEIQLDVQGERAFALLSSAERASRSVRFSYLDKNGHRSLRTIDPYGFVIHAGRIYCVGYDHERRDKRTFAVDSVSDADVLGNTFLRPHDFNIEEYAAGSISGVMHGSDMTEVTVAFAARVVKAAIAARVVEERRIERRADGSALIAYRVTDLDEMIRWVLGWGAQAEIVAPPAARTRIAQLSQEIAAKYSMSS